MKVLSEGVQLWQRFYRGKRRSKQIPLKADHHRPAIEMPFKWRFAGGSIMVHNWMLAWQLCDFQGIRTSIAKKPYVLLFFGGGGGGGPEPTFPLLDPLMSKYNFLDTTSLCFSLRRKGPAISCTGPYLLVEIDCLVSYTPTVYIWAPLT